MANASNPAPRLSADAIAAVERILERRNSVEITPVSGVQIVVKEVMRQTAYKQIDKRGANAL